MQIKPNEQFNVSAQYIQLVITDCAEKTDHLTSYWCSLKYVGFCCVK